MDPFTIGMLAAGSLSLFGAAKDSNRLDMQSKMESKINEANANMEKTNIMKAYTDVFAKQVSDLGTQQSIFATLGIDKSSTLFAKGIQEHEKAFLDNQANMKSDMETVNTNLNIRNANIKLNTSAQKSSLYSGAAIGLANAFTTFAGAKMSKGDMLSQDLTSSRIASGTRSRRGI